MEYDMSKARETYAKYSKRIGKGNKPLPEKEETGLFSDLANGVFSWMVGAEQGYNETKRATDALFGNVRPAANPLLSSELVHANYYQETPDKSTPVMTDEEQRIWNWYVRAGEQFSEGTVRPAIGTAAALAAIPAALGAAGIGLSGAALGATTALTVAPLPYMIGDIQKSVKEHGWGETTGEVVLGSIPGYENYKMEQDPNFKKFAEVHPGQAWGQRALTFAESFAPLAAPTGKLGKKTYDAGKVPLNHLYAASKSIEVQEMIKERQFLKALSTLKKKVKEGKVRPQPKPANERMVDNVQKALEIEKVNTAGDIQPYVNGGGLIDIPVAPSILTSNVRVVDIYNTLKGLATVKIGYLRDCLREVEGYRENHGGGIRVRSPIGFGVIAHEVGHKMDADFGITGCDQELIDLHLAAYGGRSPYDPSQFRSEGIAEFFREFLFNPAEAQRRCPTYYAKFTAELAQRPDTASRVELLSNQMRRWITQSPEARVRGGVFYEEDAPGQSFTERLKSYRLKKKTELIDKWAVLREVTKHIENIVGGKLARSLDPYKIAKSMRSFASARTHILLTKRSNNSWIKAFNDAFGKDVFKHSTFLADVWHEIPFREFRTKYNDWLQNAGLRDGYEAFGTYMAAKAFMTRARVMGDRKLVRIQEELNRLAHTNPTDPIELQSIQNRMQDLMRNYNEIQTLGYDPDYRGAFTYEEAASFVRGAPRELLNASLKLREFNENMLNLAEHYGLISEGIKENLLKTYRDYIPLHRMFEEDNMGMNIFDKMGANQSTLDDLPNILERLAEEGSERVIKDPMAEYNKMVQRIISRGERNQVGKALVELEERFGGLGDVLMVVSSSAPVGAKDKTFAVWVDGERRVYQATDPLLYDVLSMTDPDILASELKIIEKLSTVFREGVTASATFGLNQFFADAFTAFITSKSKKIIPVIPIIDSVMGAFKRNDEDLMAHFSVMGVRYAGRIGDSQSYRHLANEQMGQRIPDGDLKDILKWGGSYLWEGVTFFSRVAEESPRIQEFNRIYKETGDYLLAADAGREITVDFSQGSDMVRRWNKYDTFLNATIQGHRQLINIFANKETRNKAIIRTGILVSASIALWQLNHNEEWYRKTSSDLKNRYWLFKAGDTFFKIRKPPGFGLFCSAVERSLDYLFDNNKEADDIFMSHFMGEASINIIPRIMYPFFEWVANEDFFTGRDTVPKRLQDRSPELQYDSTTSYFSRSVGETLGISPMKLDKALGNLFGTLGKDILKISDQAVNKMDKEKPALGLERYPLFSAVLYNPNVNAEPIKVFYDRLGEMRTQLEDDKALGGKGKRPKGMEGLENTEKKLAKLWKKIGKTEEAKDMTPEQKKAKIEELYAEIVKKASESLKKNTDYQY